jgi:hypothetical protein
MVHSLTSHRAFGNPTSPELFAHSNFGPQFQVCHVIIERHKTSRCGSTTASIPNSCIKKPLFTFCNS